MYIHIHASPLGLCWAPLVVSDFNKMSEDHSEAVTMTDKHFWRFKGMWNFQGRAHVSLEESIFLYYTYWIVGSSLV